MLKYRLIMRSLFECWEMNVLQTLHIFISFESAKNLWPVESGKSLSGSVTVKLTVQQIDLPIMGCS